MGAVAEEAGLMSVSDVALENRASRKIVGEVVAHFQLYPSSESKSDFFWVESYDRAGEYKSGRMVEVLSEGGYTWASCGCTWFLERWKRTTTCKHILTAVRMQRKRG